MCCQLLALNPRRRDAVEAMDNTYAPPGKYHRTTNERESEIEREIEKERERELGGRHEVKVIGTTCLIFLFDDPYFFFLEGAVWEDNSYCNLPNGSRI